MADELQALLERIQSEGVDKAKAEAAAIVDAARKEAEAIRAEAAADAEKLRKDAERDAAAFASRANATVKQAMRDVKLQLADDLQAVVLSFLKDDVKATLSDGASVKDWISKAVDVYLKGGESAVAVELGSDAKAIAAAIKAELAAKASSGITVTESPAFAEGFTIRLDNGRVEQCFTAEAVSNALERLLRPELAALMRDA